MHSRTQTHGSLLKWNTQSLTFTSVRPYSFDRKRIQTEWNHHQHGCWAIDLSSPLLSIRWLTKRKLEEGVCLDWTQSLCFCLYTGLPEKEKERLSGRERKRETSFSPRNEKRLEWLWAPPQQCTLETAVGAEKRCKYSCAVDRFLTSNRVGRGRREGRRERNRETEIQMSKETWTFPKGWWKVTSSQQLTINTRFKTWGPHASTRTRAHTHAHTNTHLLPQVNGWVVMLC